MAFREVEVKQAWEAFDAAARTRLIYYLGRRIQLTPDLFETACMQVATELAQTGDPEYIRATVSPIPTVPDETRISALIAQRILQKPDVLYPMHAMDVVSAQGAIAEDIDRRVPLILDPGGRLSVVARPDVCTPFMAGAAASFRHRYPYEEGGPIIVAVGDKRFLEEVNMGLDSPDMTLPVDAQAVRYLSRIHVNARLSGQPIYVLVQNAAITSDIAGTVRLMLDDDQLPLTAIVGISKDHDVQNDPAGMGIVRSSSQLLMGHMTVSELGRFGIDERNAEAIVPRITPSMVFEVSRYNRNGLHAISRYYPLWRGDV